MDKIRANKPNIWGMHAVRGAWQNTNRQISNIYVSDNAAREFHSFQSVKGVKRPPPQAMNKKELDKLTNGAVHQGIAICAGPLEEIFLSDLMIKTAAQDKSVIIILDQVTDPHNVGAILRSACAFGAAGMIVQKKHAPALEGVLAKTACGAVEHVPVLYETNLSRTIEKLQQESFTVLGMDERGKTAITPHLPPPLGQGGGITGGGMNKIALVLGAEGAGLRPNVAKHCDELVRLEMRGPMPSINVSNAAAVGMFALTF